MEMALRLLERRFLAAIAVFLGAFWALGRWGGYAREQADWFIHPAPKSLPPYDPDIRGGAEARESAKLRKLHRSVVAEIEAAEKRGAGVRGLRQLADAALQLDAPLYRRAAFAELNKVRMSIPPKKESFGPALSPDR